MKDIQDKWDKIYVEQDSSEVNLANPAEVLLQHTCLLPETGIALDLACGLGANAIYLTKHGLTTYAWDKSTQAIDKLQTYCNENDLSIITETRDIEELPPAANSFDVICVSNYLERSITSNIIAALKPKGILFYQTFVQESVSDVGPNNPAYRLQENELLTLFSSLHILAYQDYGRVGDLNTGLRDIAMLVAQKR